MLRCRAEAQELCQFQSKSYRRDNRQILKRSFAMRIRDGLRVWMQIAAMCSTIRRGVPCLHVEVCQLFLAKLPLEPMRFAIPDNSVATCGAPNEAFFDNARFTSRANMTSLLLSSDASIC